MDLSWTRTGNSETELQVKKLEYSDKVDEYKLYRAALEWDLIHPIVIESKKDLKSSYLWRDKVDPYHHQVKNLITFCRRLPVTLLADDVGLGKTISAGLIISELVSRGRIAKILIVCPKILMPQWQEELKTKFAIHSVIATGNELVDADPPDGNGAVITTYNTARMYLEKISKAGYDMLVLDEAHKLRNLYGTDTAPQVAKRFRKALADRMFKYVLMLTATPIQNRLWDLYSLVDLLTVARGHTNPFGNEGIFARKYIADNQTDARKLRESSREEFRDVVYGYMSRIRRGDAKLQFPTREVELHNVFPTPEELELMTVATKSIGKLNRLVQIGILQSLVSSPEALVSRLEHMVENKTIPEELMLEVKEAAKHITVTAKLKGLMSLIDTLRAERPGDWRVVIFTRWLETQTTINSFLEERGISYGVINGKSGTRNQETISKFTKENPEINVIVSTEAGSEGVNLQAANVLVNYDLPWNPMIVEQRIGRIQRLGSKHDKVCIFNIVLKGTFEEYIVGRLMEKLQMASHAIGDIEALLQASGTDDGDDTGADGFEDNILKLVLASLAGKNVDEETRKRVESIKEAKIQLEQSEKHINDMLGSQDPDDMDPDCPALPAQINSMDAKTFALAALEDIGAKVTPQDGNIYISKLDGKEELIRFDNDGEASQTKSILYGPGTPAFDRLVSKITTKDLHKVEDADVGDLIVKVEKITKAWVETFEGILVSFETRDVCRSFFGNALVRVRATVAHDSYERLVEVICEPSEHFSNEGLSGLGPLNRTISDPASVGLKSKDLIKKAKLDPGIVEFSKFYEVRLDHELPAIENDERKKQKLIDDFTARFEFALQGLEGVIRRQLKVDITYTLGDDTEYTNTVTVIPSKGEMFNMPLMIECEKTKKMVPEDCLAKCEISDLRVMKNLLVKSELSGRFALPEFIVECSLTKKKVLNDEVSVSSVTGELVTKNLLKKSVLSGKIAEPEYFDKCEFSGSEVLKEELAVSQISNKKYRIDEELKSEVSGKKGHKDEFIYCAETNKPLLKSEAEVCEVTGKVVMPGILELCEVSGKKILPSELEKSAVSGKKALKKYLVSSSLSGARIFEDEAIKSSTGLFCSPQETKLCLWSGRKTHPVDLRTCHLTGVTFHFEYMTLDEPLRLAVLVNLLTGINRKADRSDLWGKIIESTSTALGNRNCKVIASEISPDGKHIAVCLEIRTMLGFILRFGGLIYSISDDIVIGRIARGNRDHSGWSES